MSTCDLPLDLEEAFVDLGCFQIDVENGQEILIICDGSELPFQTEGDESVMVLYNEGFTARAVPLCAIAPSIPSRGLKLNDASSRTISTAGCTT